MRIGHGGTWGFNRYTGFIRLVIGIVLMNEEGMVHVMRDFKSRLVISAVTAASIGVGTCGLSATADAAPVSRAHTAVQSQVRPVTVNELAAYLKSVGAERLLSADNTFDYSSARAAFGSQFADNFAAEWSANVRGSTATTGTPLVRHADGVAMQPYLFGKSAGDYAACLLKGVGLGGLVGASTAIVNALKNHAWTEAAELITKEAIKRGIKIGIKGGVWGLAAALGAYAIWCATPWG